MDEPKKPLNESAPFRWAVLLLVSVAMGTNYYFYDALSPLKEVLETQLGWSSSDYGFFMSAYSVPNVFLAMAVIGGVILDKVGIRITGVMFYGFMFLGSCLTFYGGTETFLNGGPGFAFLDSFLPQYKPSLKMMFVGFFMFGLGAETSGVVISRTVVKWFKGKELALAMALNVAFGRLGTGAAMSISPRMLYTDWFGAAQPNRLAPVALGAILLGVGTATVIFYCFIDKAFDARKKVVLSEDPFHLSDIGKLLKTPSYLFIALLCVTFYSAVFPFMKYAPDLMVNKYAVSLTTAGLIVTILPFGNIIFTPLFGWICDTRGRSASLMILGSGLLIVVHLLFALTSITPYVPMFILGIAFSLVPAAMWPSVAKIVDENRLGTAYGLMFSIQNIGLWLFPMAIGWVLDASNPGVGAAKAAGEAATYDYTNPLLMLASLGVAGLFFAFMLLRADRNSSFGLEKPNRVPAP